jgi:transcriptional regulator with XRE-family HTH domain
MVNIDDFIKRLEIILEYYGLSASAFADKVGVQRSSLSHLLSARNKPSLDLILKIVQNFPEVDLYWILIGKGDFPKLEIKTNNQPTSSSSNSVNYTNTKNENQDLFSTLDVKPLKNPIFENNLEKFSNMRNLEDNSNDQEIERIVVFYKNGYFKNYISE